MKHTVRIGACQPPEFAASLKRLAQVPLMTTGLIAVDIPAADT